MGWRDFCVGAVGGAMLSIARPAAGITLEEWMNPSGERMALWRAGAVIAIAVGLIAQPARRGDARFPAAELALGAASGFALHGFLLVDLFAFDSSLGWILALAAGLGVLLALRTSSVGEAADPDASSTPLLERLALAISGGGLALVFAALNSRLCLFATGTREDDTITGATALALFAVAASAFGPLFARRLFAPAWFALGLGAAACLALSSFDFMGEVSLPRVYVDFLRRFELDSSWRGSIAYDALFAARVLALPALISGIAFASLRSDSSLGWALLGAAIAAILLPNWSRGFDAATIETVGIQASERAAFGASLAAIGALFAALAGMRAAWKSRAGLALAALTCFFGAQAWDRAACLPLSPWERVVPRVEWIRETSEGLLTVELQAARGRIATLDRRRLTPTAEELPAEELRWRSALSKPDTRACVAVAGLLTPQRALLLRVFDVPRAWFMSPWPELDSELEEALFAADGRPDRLTIEHGRGWSSSESSGGAGLVHCPPVEAASRTLACLDRGNSTAFLALGWLPAHQEVAQLDWGDAVVASCSHVDDFSIGIGSAGANPLRAGSRARRPTLAQLRRTLPEREKTSRVRAAERLVRGEASPAARALLLLCSAQVQSSPFETRAQRTELDPQALALLSEAGLAAKPAGFERELDEFVAATLEQRRDLDGLSAFAQPLADRHPAWPILQRAAAHADWEFFRYSEAAARLERLVQATPYDLQARLWLTEAWLRAENPSAAIRAADDTLAIQPNRFDVERLRAIAAARAGDPRASAWIQALLLEHPKDAELAAHAGPGPFPPLQPPVGVPGEIGPAEEP